MRGYSFHFSKMAQLQEVHSSKSSAVIHGITTDVVCYGYSNRIFVIVTQLKRPGTLIHIEKQDACRDASLSENSVEISMDVLLGVDDPVYRAFANKFATMVYRDSRKPILLAIALKEKQPLIIREIAELLLENRVW